MDATFGPDLMGVFCRHAGSERPNVRERFYLHLAGFRI